MSDTEWNKIEQNRTEENGKKREERARMESVVWYRRISFRLFMVTALIAFLPMYLFWNYSLRSASDFLSVEHADSIYTSLYGA